MHTLEEFRSQPLIGEVGYRVDETTIRPLMFHEYANTAYYLTVDALRNFEEADAIGAGPFLVPAITFWFMASESYVSTIYKTCSSLDEALLADNWTLPFGRLRKTAKIVEKAQAVKKWVAGDCPPAAPTRRLHEFATFRNALLHDLTSPAPRTVYAHTLFSPRAEKSNQVDLMEALNVSLETFGYFRFLFHGADLMPSIAIGAAVDKLDTLAHEVLQPAFADILEAKHLTCAIKPPLAEACPAELLAHMQFLIRTDGLTAPTRRQRRNELLVEEYQRRAQLARPVDEGKFQVPNYARSPSPAKHGFD